MNQQDMIPNLDIRKYVPPSTKPEWQLDQMTNTLNEKVQKLQESRSSQATALQQTDNQMMSLMKQRTTVEFPAMGMK